MSDDNISRQAAIAEFSCCELTPDGGIDVNYAIDFLKQMPSAQPERKKWKWMHDKDDELFSGYCSCCGWESVICETDVADMPYCPNCGAYMRGEQE